MIALQFLVSNLAERDGVDRLDVIAGTRQFVEPRLASNRSLRQRL